MHGEKLSDGVIPYTKDARAPLAKEYSTVALIQKKQQAELLPQKTYLNTSTVFNK